MGKYSLAYPAGAWLDQAVIAPDKPWLNRYVASAPVPTLLASCFSVMTREMYGALKSLPAATRQDWADYINAMQSADSGLFVDPIFSKEDLSGKVHGVDYLLWQFTFFSAAALHSLGAKPKRPFCFLEDFFIKNPSIEDWLAGLNWADPWLVSNEIMFLASFLIQETERDQNERYREIIRRIFDWLDENQSSETGFWDLGQGASPHYTMAGAFHFYFLYFYLDRPVNFIEKIIDSTLAVQHPDGLYGPAGGGGACLDLDAVDILVKFSLLTDYRAGDVKSSLKRSFEALMKNQNSDGGFCEAKRPPLWKKSRKRKLMELFGVDRLLNRPWQGRPVEYQNYSGWTRMRQRIDESDLWSAWFRPLALGLISVRYPGEFIDDILWQFPTSPMLGWHDQEKLALLRKKYYDVALL